MSIPPTTRPRLRTQAASLAFTALFAITAQGQFTTVINLDDADDVGPIAIGADTQVNVSGDGVLFGQFLTHNVGSPDGSATNIEVNLSGGTLAGGVVNFFGGSTTKQSGGLFEAFSATFHDGATLNVTGGAGSPFVAGTPTFRSGSTLKVFGSEFFVGAERVAGLEQPGDEINLSPADLDALGGIVANGQRYSLSAIADAGATIALSATAPPPTLGEAILAASTRPAPAYLRAGQRFTLDVDAELPDGFLAGPGSRIIVEANNTAPSGGVSAPDVFAVAAEIEIRDGASIGVSAENGSRVRLTGGRLASLITSIDTESELIVTGGEAPLVTVEGGSRARISGGVLGGVQTLGDERNGGVRLFDNSELHLIGKEFALGGAPIAGLVNAGDSVVVDDRTMRLTGALLDGETFLFNLGLGFSPQNRSSFSEASTIRLTLIPEPSTLALVSILAGGGSLDRRRRTRFREPVTEGCRSPDGPVG